MGTVSKALDLLGCFSHLRPRFGLTELAKLSGTNKATCFRLMSELQEFGYVEQIGAGREYRLGPAVLRLAALREAHVPTRETAMPVLEALARATGETAHLSLLMGGQLTTLAFVYSADHGTKVMMEDADILPFHATSSGHAVLAFLPDPEVAAILSRPLPRLTLATETTAADIRARLSAVRAEGLAETAGTFESDVKSAAAPLFDLSGRCIGSIGVAAPAARMTDSLRQRIRAELVRAAQEITAIWGGRVPEPLATYWRSARQGERR